MALTAEDKQEVARIVAQLLADLSTPEPEPEPEPSRPGVFEPDERGPLAAGVDGVETMMAYVWLMNDYSAALGNRFKKSDVYRMLVELIRKAEFHEEVWVQGSEDSWRFCREALMTRASEVEGDHFTTEWPVFESHEQAMSSVDYGVTENLLNIADIVYRKVAGAYIAQSSDRDVGSGDQPLTNGECVRLCFHFLDALTDSNVVPNGADSNFMKVRKELYNQYKALGEGSFGPWAHPGGSTPWSWAGKE